MTQMDPSKCPDHEEVTLFVRQSRSVMKKIIRYAQRKGPLHTRRSISVKPVLTDNPLSLTE